MTITTKGGDEGKTSLFGGTSVSKADPRVETYGSLDELTSVIGLITTKLQNPKEKSFLITIQKDLYQLMSLLSGASIKLDSLAERLKSFEQEIAKAQKELPKQTRFILPGSTETSAFYHLARVACRRSERRVVGFYEMGKHSSLVENYRVLILKYLNRLSDFFFVMARLHAKEQEIFV